MFFDCSKILSNQILNIKQPRRAQIYVGFQCHQRCGFCYYRHKCNEQMFNIDFIKKQIDFEYNYGIRDFEITGGEPSEFTYLKEICQYIKSKDSNSKIAIITNGGLWKSDVWDYIDEILLSYHLGKESNIYDKNIFPLGNTYEKAYKTILKAHKLKKLVRTNTVIGTFNINALDDILQDIVEFNPYIINFLPVNLFDQATDMFKYIDYDLLRSKLKTAIDILTNILPQTNVFIRYIPFCNMDGYESHIVGHLQHIFDWFDWNRELDGTEFLQYIKDEKSNELLNKLEKYGSTSITNVMNIRKQLYSKSNKCLKCKYMLICDGVEKTQLNILEKYIMPSNGTLVKNPLAYNKNITKKLYDNIYANTSKIE